jgi:hypothetical protein
VSSSLRCLPPRPLHGRLLCIGTGLGRRVLRHLERRGRLGGHTRGGVLVREETWSSHASSSTTARRVMSDVCRSAHPSRHGRACVVASLPGPLHSAQETSRCCLSSFHPRSTIQRSPLGEHRQPDILLRHSLAPTHPVPPANRQTLRSPLCKTLNARHARCLLTVAAIAVYLCSREQQS